VLQRNVNEPTVTKKIEVIKTSNELVIFMPVKKQIAYKSHNQPGLITVLFD